VEGRWEAVLFNDELELLEARFHEGQDDVDKWVILEAAETFTGKPKPLYFEENKNLFEPWLDRVVHVVADLPAGEPWDRERAQRDALSQVQIPGNDVVALCDGDELVARWAWPVLENKTATGTVVLPMQQYYYTLRWATPLVLARTRAARRKDIGRFGEWADTPPPSAFHEVTQLDGAGWHLSCLGGPERVAKKLQSFSHTELSDPMWANIDNCRKVIKQGWDLDPTRRYHLELVEPAGPEWLLSEGVKKWPWLLTGDV
jgi:hypothetical protein